MQAGIRLATRRLGQRHSGCRRPLQLGSELSDPVREFADGHRGRISEGLGGKYRRFMADGIAVLGHPEHQQTESAVPDTSIRPAIGHLRTPRSSSGTTITASCSRRPVRWEIRHPNQFFGPSQKSVGSHCPRNFRSRNSLSCSSGRKYSTPSTR